MTKFSELGLSDSILKALPELGIDNPTHIQAQSIPLLTQQRHRDFLGLAQTGTGKTAAFGLPLIEAMDIANRSTQALVLAPTRELSQQIEQQLTAFSKYLNGLEIQVVYGGASIVPQMKALKRKPQIVIATPGRLLDLINRRAVDLSGVRHVVLDEADEMLNMGFRDDIDEILSNVKGQMSTWLFSATLAPELKKIVKKYMTDPLEIKVDSSNVVNKNIEHLFFTTTRADKTNVIKRIVELEVGIRGVIFCRTKRETQELSDQLQKEGIPVDAIHGDLSQAQRDAVMKRFKSHQLELLIATDVAARGIDVNDLTHVIHHSLPDELEYYTHRSGRTARAGKTGTSIVLINGREKRRLNDLEKQLKLTIKPYEFPQPADVERKLLTTWAENIKQVEVDSEKTSKHKAFISELWAELDREQLIEKLMSQKLQSLDISHDHQFELVENKRPLSNKKITRFYLNIGVIDGVTNKELADMVADTSGVPRKVIKEVHLEEKHSLVDVENEFADMVIPAFEGLFFDNRRIRIKVDNEKPRDKSRSKHRDRGDKRRGDKKRKGSRRRH